VSKINFTIRALEDLNEDRKKRYSVFDTHTRHLAIAVYPSGAKTFYHLKKVQGWPQRTTIGPFPDVSIEKARAKAAELNSDLTSWKIDGYEGPNPVKKNATAKVATLGDALESYIEKHLRGNAKNPDKAIEYARWQFEKYLGAWKNRPLGSVQRGDIRQKHSEIGRAHGEITANRCITFLRTLFNHCLDPDYDLWDGMNPCAKPKKFLFHEETRDRIVKDEEKPKFFAELAKEPHRDLRDVLLLALSTGSRIGALLAMRWEEVDFDHDVWVISRPKGRKGHSAPLVVPLNGLAARVLGARHRTGVWVFKGKQGNHLTTVRKPWEAFLKRTGITDLHIHDLRRSLATEAGESGASEKAIQGTLGHAASSEATKIYDRSKRTKEIRDATTTAMRRMLATAKVSQKKLLGAPNA
jgi:integrase